MRTPMRLMTWLCGAALILAPLLSAGVGPALVVVATGAPPSPMGKTLATFPMANARRG